MSPAPAVTRTRRARPRRGFTIVELIVAIMVLSVGLLALASSAGYTTRQMSSASLQTIAAQVTQSRFDSLASVSCAALPASGTVSGKSTTRGVTETWSVTDGNDVKFILDSITYKGRKKPLEYRSVIPCRD